ncbi:MAG: hypothetical protein LBC96_03045 [Lachnospiraceae bacterium]|jgi:hypothetical protein|nr:hypothetical protein [Lachnospiraceae bacterium]
MEANPPNKIPNKTLLITIDISDKKVYNSSKYGNSAEISIPPTERSSTSNVNNGKIELKANS